MASDSVKGHVVTIFALQSISIARNALRGLRGRIAEARVALLRYRMAEVYAVLRAAAPAPAGAYPVWHEDVGTVTIARLHMQPNGLGALSRAASGVENRGYKDCSGELALLPAGSKFGCQRSLLLLDGLPLRCVWGLHSAEFGFRGIRYKPGCGWGKSTAFLEFCLSPGHNRVHQKLYVGLFR
jgi:hypothetical protein